MRISHWALAAIAGVALLAGAAAAWHFTRSPTTPGATAIPAPIEKRIARLTTRLRAAPEDVAAWATLGRTYASLGRFAESAAAYKQAASLRPADAQLLADYADAQAMTQGRRLRGEPEPLILRALELDPANVKALSLSGSLLYEKGDYAGAARQWRRLLPLVPADSDFARVARARIEAAELRAGARP